MANVDDGSDVPMLSNSSNILLMVLSFISTEWVTAQSTHNSKSLEIICNHSLGFAKFDNHVKTFSEAVGMVTSRITSVEQTVNALSGKIGVVCNIGTERQHSDKVSALSLHAYSKLKRTQRPSPVVPTPQDHGTNSDVAMAPQPLGPLGPLAHRHLMTAEKQDEDLIRSQGMKMNMREVGALLMLTCEQYHRSTTKWIKCLWE